ncbi:hypothetical protein M011DRAFT_407994 [Sporormia fimetaria CBS 119925]|uniref:Sin3-associated polypeptide Sap18 n=1 Tax=Sporormia fimetaria CBS 119925 TaxID=1340428 RepID=A0A6A6V4P2_9PLEO|nr:hypothetical protein M011DRAFT_407994 [Sporormia fimetaria CBS 119925]
MAESTQVDRQKTTPFLLRLFYKTGQFHRLDEFAAARPPPHLQIYTWPSCTLSELTHLLLTALPSLLPAQYAGTRIAFRLIFPDMQGPQRPGMTPHYIARDLGSVIVGAASIGDSKADADNEEQENNDVNGKAQGELAKEALKQLSGELNKTLHDSRFVIGDYISAAILPPLADGSVAASPPPASVPSRGPPPRDPYSGRPGPRENGYGGREADFDRYPRGGRSAGREEDRRAGGFPAGEWRRGEAPPAPDRDAYWRGGGGRGRGRGRW